MNTKIHDLTLWGHKVKISDEQHSTTPGFIERDINLDTHACRLLHPKPKVIVDIGANVGIWSLAMAKQYPDAQIFAVEPTEHNMANLRYNCELNEVKSVTPVLHSIYSEAGNLTLYQNPSNSGSCSMFLVNDMLEPINTKAITLDGLIDLLPVKHIDLLKMDVEGCEYQIFNAFTRWNRVSKVTIEAHILPLHADKKENARLSVEIIERFYKFLCEKLGTRNVCVQGPTYSYEWGRKVELPPEYIDPEIL